MAHPGSIIKLPSWEDKKQINMERKLVTKKTFSEMPRFPVFWDVCFDDCSMGDKDIASLVQDG